jgi:hypothetical protein
VTSLVLYIELRLHRPCLLCPGDAHLNQVQEEEHLAGDAKPKHRRGGEAPKHPLGNRVADSDEIKDYYAVVCGVITFYLTLVVGSFG